MAALSAMGVDVYTKQTKTLPSFMMPFANPKHDVDVSGQMHVNGHIEIGLTQVSESPTKCCGPLGPLPQNRSDYDIHHYIHKFCASTPRRS